MTKKSFWKSMVAGVAALAIFGAGSIAEARPHGPHGPPPMHHHHHHHGGDAVLGACLALGLIGTAAALAEPEPVIVRQPVVVQQPVVMQQPVVVQQPVAADSNLKQTWQPSTVVVQPPAPVVVQPQPVVYYRYSRW